MYGILIVLHVLICLGLVIVVLLQSAKGEGLAGAFGGTSLTGTVFGGRGAATFLSRATTVLAVAFMTSCIVLTFVTPRSSTASAVQGSSAVEEAAKKGSAPATAPPAMTPPAQGTDQKTQSTPPTDPNADLFTPENQGKKADQAQKQEQPKKPAAAGDSR